jgi:hypothetical protein
MSEKKLGSLNDFSQELGIDPRSNEALELYSEELTKNYYMVREKLQESGVIEHQVRISFNQE